jgi:hypothetical protein
MSITTEKDEIVKRIYEEKDEFVIHAIKELLDSSSSTHPANNEALEREIDQAIKEADNGELLSYNDVLAEFRKKHN